MYNRQIKAFVETARLGSFSKAAECLYLTPAAVINQVNLLEEKAGVKLLERTRQGTQLTPAGIYFYREAQAFIDESDRAMADVKQMYSQALPSIRIGFSPINPSKPLVDFCKAHHIFSEYQIKAVPFTDGVSSQLSITTGLGSQFDVIFGPCTSHLQQQLCNFLPLEGYHLCCAVSNRHKLAEKDLIRPEDLLGEQLMMSKAGDSDIFDSLRLRFQEQYPQIQIVDMPFFYDINIFNLCEERLGVLLSLPIWEDVHPALNTIPLAVEDTIPCGVIYAKQPGPAVIDFVDTIHTALEQEEKRQKSPL